MKTLRIRRSRIELYCGDAMRLLRGLPDASVDACMTDPPYGTTACGWDNVIPFAPLWLELKRVVKRNGAILLFGVQPFTSQLVCSNLKMFRYQFVWNKRKATNYLFGNKQPMKLTEDVAVFYQAQPTYNPQKTTNPNGPVKRCYRERRLSAHGFQLMSNKPHVDVSSPAWEADKLLPTNILEYSKPSRPQHPTEKPVALLRHFVRTYTNPGDTILDFTFGSGSMPVACALERRHFMGSENNRNYFRKAERRLNRSPLA